MNPGTKVRINLPGSWLHNHEGIVMESEGDTPTASNSYWTILVKIEDSSLPDGYELYFFGQDELEIAHSLWD